MIKLKCLQISKNGIAYQLLLIMLCVLSPFKLASIISLIVFMLYIVYLSAKHPQVVFKYIYFFFAVTTNIIGCAICELTNIYLPEIEVYAHFVGSLPLLILSRSLFLALIVHYEKSRRVNAFGNLSIKINGKIITAATLGLAVIYSILFIKVFHHPSFGLSIDRFSYANAGILSNLWKTIANYSNYLIVVPIVCFTYTKRKIIPLITIFIYLLFNIWMGNKFGTIFNVFSFFCLVYFSRKQLQTRKIRVALLASYGMILFLVIFAAILQMQFGAALANSKEYLFSRLAQQGQLWWRTVDLCKLTIHPSEFANEIPALFRSNAAADSIGTNNGIYMIMYLCTPTARVNNSLLHGARYTEAGYAAAYYYLGAFGCILFTLFMFVLAVMVTNHIVEFAKKENIIGLFVEVRFYMIVCSSLSMFTFSDFFTVASLLSYVVLICFSKRVSLGRMNCECVRTV